MNKLQADARLHEAAVRIQSSFRGKITRDSMRKGNTAAVAGTKMLTPQTSTDTKSLGAPPAPAPAPASVGQGMLRPAPASASAPPPASPSKAGGKFSLHNCLECPEYHCEDGFKPNIFRRHVCCNCAHQHQLLGEERAFVPGQDLPAVRTDAWYVDDSVVSQISNLPHTVSGHQLVSFHEEPLPPPPPPPVAQTSPLSSPLPSVEEERFGFNDEVSPPPPPPVPQQSPPPPAAQPQLLQRQSSFSRAMSPEDVLQVPPPSPPPLRLAPAKARSPLPPAMPVAEMSPSPPQSPHQVSAGPSSPAESSSPDTSPQRRADSVKQGGVPEKDKAGGGLRRRLSRALSRKPKTETLTKTDKTSGLGGLVRRLSRRASTSSATENEDADEPDEHVDEARLGIDDETLAFFASLEKNRAAREAEAEQRRRELAEESRREAALEQARLNREMELIRQQQEREAREEEARRDQYVRESQERLQALEFNFTWN